MLCSIYKLYNLIDNKLYIGQTWRTLEKRFNNGRGYIDSLYLNNAIQKYGKENFEYEILTVCSTQEIADYWEDYFIIKYNSTDRNIGYNIKFGGSNGKLAQETKNKLSISHTGKVYPEERKKKISIRMKNNKIMLGKILPLEVRQKMSTTRVQNGTFRGENNNMAKLNWKEVIEIRVSNEPNKILAEKYIISERTIRDIKNNKTWKL